MWRVVAYAFAGKLNSLLQHSLCFEVAVRVLRPVSTLDQSPESSYASRTQETGPLSAEAVTLNKRSVAALAR